MKKINLNSAAFLGLGVFFLLTPALSQAIITSLVTAFFRDIDLLLWVNLAQNFWILNLIPKVVGATLVAGFAWKHLKTRFKVDLPKIKVQTTRLATYSLLFMLCAGLFLFADVPVSEAATTATTGYILDTPVSEYAWLIGAYSDGTYYAIEGSTWDNKVAGVGSTAWASYKTNSTKITELVLDSTTSGAIYMKDVAFDMNLFDDIPEGVRVICSYNAEFWEYINSADSSGSPYTVSVGSGVNNGYYLAQDRQGRICYTSLTASSLINDCFDSLVVGRTWQEKVFLSGEFKVTSIIEVPNYTVLDLHDAVLSVQAGFTSNYVVAIGGKNVEILGGKINGNNVSTQTPHSAIVCYPSTEVENLVVSGVEITGIRDGISVAGGGGTSIKILDCYIHDLYNDVDYGGNGISVSSVGGNQTDILIENNILENLGYVQTAGITLNSNVDGSTRISRAQIINNIVGGVKRLFCIQLYYHVYESIVSGNTLYSWTLSPIKVDGSSNNIISNNIIMDYNLDDYPCKYGIHIMCRENQLAENNQIIGNTIRTAKCYIAIIVEGTANQSALNNIVSENKVYNTDYVGDRGAIEISYATSTKITNNYVYTPRTHGIKLENSIYSLVDNNEIYRPGDTSNVQGHGIYFAGGTPHFSTATNNRLYSVGIGNHGDCDGIVINGSYVVVENNYIHDWSLPRRMRYAVNEVVGSNYNTIRFNNIVYREGTSIVNIVGADTEVKGNLGFVTENSGTATILDDDTSVVVTHGLAGTPTLVTVGIQHAELAGVIWSADATNITFTVSGAVTGNRTLTWYAEYQP